MIFNSKLKIVFYSIDFYWWCSCICRCVSNVFYNLNLIGVSKLKVEMQY